MTNTDLKFRLFGQDVSFGKATDKAEKNVKGLGKTMEGLGPVAAGAGAAAATALSAGLFANMDAEATTDKLAAQLGASGKEAQRIGEVASGLYADAWGSSLDEVSGAVGSVIGSFEDMGDATSKELRDTTTMALDFATIFETDVARAAQVAGVAVKSGLADNATQAFDLMTSASQKVPAALREDVLDAVEEYSTFFDQLGLNGKQAFGLLVQGASKGQYGIDKAGDALKEFTIRSTDMSTASVAAYKAIGLDAGKMANEILAGGDSASAATQKIAQGILGIKDPAAQANAAIALFGTPLEDLGTKDIPKFLQALSGAAPELQRVDGAAAAAGQTLNDNAKTTLTAFQRQATMAFSEAAAAVVGFGMQHQGVVLPMIGALSSLAAIVLTVGAATKAWAAIQAVAKAATVGWTAVQWLLNAALTANPIGLVIVAIAALVAGIIIAYKKSDTFRAIVQKAGQVAGAAFGFVWDMIKRLVGWIRNNWPLLLGIITGPIGLAVSLVVKNFDKIMDAARTIHKKITGFFNGAGEWLRNAGKRIIDGLIGGITDKIAALREKISQAASIVRDHWPFSPAKEGPLRSHPMDQAGGNIVDMLAGGMSSRFAHLGATTGQAAGVVAATVAGPPRLGRVGGSTTVVYQVTITGGVVGTDPNALARAMVDAFTRRTPGGPRLPRTAVAAH